MTDRLFDVGPVPAAPQVAEPEKLSATARRTLRQRQQLERGIHPATGRRLRLEPGKTCGDCAHHVPVGNGRRTWHKCLRTGVSSGPATDIRISWPACELFIEEGDA